MRKSYRVDAPHRPQRVGYLTHYRYVRLRWHVLFGLIDAIGTCLFALARCIGLVRRATGVASPRAILLVQLDHLGDAVITTAMLPPLRKRYPHASLEVLAGPRSADVFAACPVVDRVHVLPSTRFDNPRRGLWLFTYLRAAWRLRQRCFDIGIDVRGELPHALILWLCGARRRIGWICGGGGFLLTDSPQYLPHRPEIESRFALLKQLCIAPPLDTDTCRAIDPGNSARERIAGELIRLRSPEQPLIVLHIGAGTAAKAWPIEHWRELIGRTIVEHAPLLVLVGSDGDRARARRITGDSPWPSVVDWTGCLTLRELAALVERADLFIGADSGPAHLAAAMGTRVIALFSGTNEVVQWRPWGLRTISLCEPVACSPCHRTVCPLADHPCMSRLTPSLVLRAMGDLCYDPARHSVARWLDATAPAPRAIAKPAA